jgi:hypothetical protein
MTISTTTSQTVSLLKDFKRWDLITMLIMFGALFTFEMFGVFKAHYVTITEIICNSVPKWARAMILGWLGYHFLIEH